MEDMLMLTHDTRHLTEEEIHKEYPNQWLGLTEVKWNKERNCDIDSAVVTYCNMTKSQVSLLQSRTRNSENPVIKYPTLIYDGTYVVLAN